jgi:hypothetical protein
MARHIRFETSRGPVHVFMPDGYSGGGTVVYVHGYYDSVDTAWDNHRLEAQFAASKRNAMFIAIEAPQKSGDPVRWTNLEDLLEEVEFRVGTRPPGQVCAMAHSAGFETVAKWLGDSRLTTIILLDALYGFVTQYVNWANQPGHQITVLVTKSGTPRNNAEGILDKLTGIIANPGDAISSFAKAAKAAVVFSNKTHMLLVQPQSGPISNWTIPTLLASRSRMDATGSLLRSIGLGVAGLGLGLVVAGISWGKK